MPVTSEAAGVRHVAVIGTGTIGASWTALFLARGLDVTASDPAPDAEAALRRHVAESWPALVQLGIATGGPPDRLRFVRSAVDAVRSVQFVQENSPEREDLKRAVLGELDGALPGDVVIASSTSGLLMSRLQAGLRHPERCVIGHPFNPPHLIPLVEVVGGERSSADAIERAMRFYAALGKHPIHIRKEVKGHVANRLQAALWREAVHLVAEGVASVADVDAAIAHGPGLRWALMGPHMTFHLGGGTGGMQHFMTQFAGPLQDWWKDLGAPALTPEVRAKIIAGIAAEAAGRSIEQLAKERDEKLIGVLRAMRQSG